MKLTLSLQDLSTTMVLRKQHHDLITVEFTYRISSPLPMRMEASRRPPRPFCLPVQGKQSTSRSYRQHTTYVATNPSSDRENLTIVILHPDLSLQSKRRQYLWSWLNSGTTVMDSPRLLSLSLNKHQRMPTESTDYPKRKYPTRRNVRHNFPPLYFYKMQIVSQKRQLLLMKKRFFWNLGSCVSCFSRDLPLRISTSLSFLPLFCRLSPPQIRSISNLSDVSGSISTASLLVFFR